MTSSQLTHVKILTNSAPYAVNGLSGSVVLSLHGVKVVKFQDTERVGLSSDESQDVLQSIEAVLRMKICNHYRYARSKYDG